MQSLQNWNRRKLQSVLLLDLHEEDLQSKRFLLQEVLGADGNRINIENCLSVSEARKKYKSTPWAFCLIVADLQAPPTRASDEGNFDVVSGPAAFLEREVLGGNYSPPPPILIASRMEGYGLHLLSESLAQKKNQIEVVKHSELDRSFLHRRLREWGLETRNNPEITPILGDEPLSTRADLTKRMAEKFGPIYRGSAEAQSKLFWQAALELESELTRRDLITSIIDGVRVAREVYDWFRAATSAVEKSGKGDIAENLAWLRLMEAELLWFESPIEALYLFIDAMILCTDLEKEPVGLPGEPIYKAANRLRNAGREYARQSYSHDLWRKLLREKIAQSTSAIRHYPKGLGLLEKKLGDLLHGFERAGNLPAVLEVEARLCEVRSFRLWLIPRLVSRLLKVSCDYGNQPSRLGLCCLFLVSGFALLYYPHPSRWYVPSWWPECLWIRLGPTWPYEPAGHHGIGVVLKQFITALYVSVVTFVTLGYGDIVPVNTFGRCVAMMEVVFGFTSFGLLVSVISTKLRPR